MKSVSKYLGWIGFLALALSPCAFGSNVVSVKSGHAETARTVHKRGGDGNGGWGGGGWGGGGGTPVPEGGNTLMYLSLAVLGCGGAVFMRRR